MRPVRLDLDGFASFRDPATIDFADADYFAFVGPTGSGKSTVVDAMTFALYGSAPRWGSISSIQYALAPTANRCTVRLIFDVAGQRYVVAREVRRSGAQISQRNCSLERYLDPAATGDPAADEPTEILAENPRTARDQVVELLGLDFEDFCTCVVLPQGDFAVFLKASSGERQKILLKLIGAKHYDDIGRLAGRRAAEAATRVDVLTGQLGELADATEEAEATARSRETELAELQPIAADAVAAITAVTADLAATRQDLDRTAAETKLLSSVSAPPGVDEVQRASTDAEEAYRTAGKQEQHATAAAELARQAAERGPQRAAVQAALDWRRERESGVAGLGAVAERARSAADDASAAEDAARDAETRLDRSRGEHASATAEARAASADLSALQSRIATLAAIKAPDGLGELSTAGAAARAARDAAGHEMGVAEAELTAVRELIEELPERSALDETGRTIQAYSDEADRVAALVSERSRAANELATAEVRLQRAGDARDEARTRRDRARVESVAADLRPRLHVGEPCPVCDQSVATLPPPVIAPSLDAARHALAEAERELAAAVTAHQAETTTLARIDTRLDGATARRDQLDLVIAARLPERAVGAGRDVAADRSALAALLSRVETAARQRDVLLGRLAAARTAEEAANVELRRVDAAAGRARGDLHATLGRLAAEQPPSIDAADVAAGWAELSAWAAGHAAELTDSGIPAAQAAAAETQATLTRASAELSAAVQADRLAAQAHTAAALAAQRAALDHDRLLDRLAELERLLSDQPETAELTRLLAESDRLAVEASLSQTTAMAATRTRRAAETVRDDTRAERDHARTSLLAERERLVALGVPPVDATDLVRAWQGLLDVGRRRGHHAGPCARPHSPTRPPGSTTSFGSDGTHWRRPWPDTGSSRPPNRPTSYRRSWSSGSAPGLGRPRSLRAGSRWNGSAARSRS